MISVVAIVVIVVVIAIVIESIAIIAGMVPYTAVIVIVVGGACHYKVKEVTLPSALPSSGCGSFGIHISCWHTFYAASPETDLHAILYNDADKKAIVVLLDAQSEIVTTKDRGLVGLRSGIQLPACHPHLPPSAHTCPRLIHLPHFRDLPPLAKALGYYCAPHPHVPRRCGLGRRGRRSRARRETRETREMRKRRRCRQHERSRVVCAGRGGAHGWRTWAVRAARCCPGEGQRGFSKHGIRDFGFVRPGVRGKMK